MANRAQKFISHSSQTPIKMTEKQNKRVKHPPEREWLRNMSAKRFKHILENCRGQSAKAGPTLYCI